MHLIVIGVRMKLDCVTHEHAWDVTGVCLFTPFLRHSAKLIKNCRFRPTRPTCIWHSCLGWRQNPIFLKTIPQSLHFKKKKQSPSNCCYCSDRAQNLPGEAPTFGSHCSRFHPNWITFYGVTAERIKTVFAP